MQKVTNQCKHTKVFTDEQLQESAAESHLLKHSDID